MFKKICMGYISTLKVSSWGEKCPRTYKEATTYLHNQCRKIYIVICRTTETISEDVWLNVLYWTNKIWLSKETIQPFTIWIPFSIKWETFEDHFLQVAAKLLKSLSHVIGLKRIPTTNFKKWKNNLKIVWENQHK